MFTEKLTTSAKCSIIDSRHNRSLMLFVLPEQFQNTFRSQTKPFKIRMFADEKKERKRAYLKVGCNS